MLLCLGGSLRDHSLTEATMRLAATISQDQGVNARIISVRDINFFLNPDAITENDSRLHQLRESVEEAKSVFVISPIYGGTVSGAVKNLVDMLHLFKQGDRGALSGRRIGVAAIGGGAIKGEYTYQPGATIALEIACQHLGGWVSPYHLELSELMFDSNQNLIDPVGKDQLRSMVTRLVGGRA